MTFSFKIFFKISSYLKFIAQLSLLAPQDSKGYYFWGFGGCFPSLILLGGGGGGGGGGFGLSFDIIEPQ